MSLDAKAERQSRHTELYEAIHNDLSHAVGKLLVLKDTLEGSGEPTGETPSAPAPTPATVYADSPGDIRDFSSRIIALTNEIRQMVL